MKICLFDTRSYDKDFFCLVNKTFQHELTFFDANLTEKTVIMAKGFPCVCVFVNDVLNETVIRLLVEGGCKLLALRSAGFNHVDLVAAERLGLTVVRVPEYSPYAVAELALALLLTVNRKIHKSYNRVREGNFSLEGLVGFDLHGKTIGVVGTGKIGRIFLKIMQGMGCRLLAYDLRPDPEIADETGCRFVSFDELLVSSHIISLHVPLTPKTHHMIDMRALNLMNKGTVLINTGRGALIDTKALINSLKSCHLGAAGLDVYEEEEGLFFHDLSGQVLTDDLLSRLLTFPNVVLTGHQGFLTKEALQNIAEITLQNVRDFESGQKVKNIVNLRMK